MALRRSTAAVLAVALVLALVALADAAEAAAPGGGGSLGAVASDGASVLAWVPAPGTVRVADEEGTSFDTRAPDGCADHLSELRLGGGSLALLCWDAARIRSNLAVLDLATRRWRALPDPGGWREAAGGRLGLAAVGARWLVLGTDTGRVLVDLASGTAGPPTAGPGEALDLDAERPFQPLCPPLSGLPTAYAPPWALTTGRTLTLRRCDTGAATALDAGVAEAQLGSGIVSWEAASLSRRAARAHLARCRLTLGWRGWTFSAVAHTRSALYTSSGGQLRRHPFPRRCPAAPRMRIGAVGGRPRLSVVARMWPTRPGGGPIAQRPPGTPRAVPTLPRVRGPLELSLPFPASNVVWRVGARRWTARMPGSDGRRWRFAGPRRRGTTRVVVEARDGRGAVSQRYLLAVVR